MKNTKTRRVNIENLRYVWKHDSYGSRETFIVTSAKAFINYVQALTLDQIDKKDCTELNEAAILLRKGYDDQWIYFGGKYGEPMENLEKFIKKLYKDKRVFGLRYGHCKEVEKTTIYGRKYMDTNTRFGSIFKCSCPDIIY